MEAPDPDDRAEASCRALVERASVAIFRTGFDGRLQFVNPAAARLLGYDSPAALLATGVDLRAVHADPARLADYLAAMQARGEVSGFELPVWRRDGVLVWLSLDAWALRDAEGRITGVEAVAADVTERRRAERAALRTAEERFRQTFERAPFSVQVFAPDGTTLRVNRAWEELWGVTLEQLGGYNILQDPQLAVKGVLPLIERAFAGEAVIVPPVKYEPAETQAVSGAVPYRWVRAIAYPVLDEDGRLHEVVLIHEDITARRDAEEALARQLRLVRTISDNATLALLLVDARQHCTFMNPAAEQMTGYTLAEVQGKPLHEFLHHTRPDGTPYPLAECPIDRALPERNRMQGEEIFIRRDGAFYPIAFTASPILEDGVPVGTVVEVADITERKRAEAEREALLERERTARREAEAAVAIRDAFLSMAAHELRTPLTPLRGSLQLIRRQLARGATTAELDLLAARAALQEERLARLVGAMLDVSRIQAGKLTVERVPLDLVALTRRVVEELPPAWIPPREVVLDLPRVAVLVAGDELRLEQVLVNLLENARKYSPPNTPITVWLSLSGVAARLAVRDEGAGIPAAEQERIFERFHRAPDIDPGVAGFGLGLFIAREIAHAHGGTLTVTSAPGAGSTFTLMLPLQTPATEP